MVCNRSPMYFLFVGIQHVLLMACLLGFFVGPMKRDKTLCADEAGLLMVQITAAADIGVKAFMFILMTITDRLGRPAETSYKPIGCFITVSIYWVLSLVFVVVGSVTIKKSAYYLFLQGAGFANEGAFHLYNRYLSRSQ